MIGDVVLEWVSAVHAQGEIGFVFHPGHHGHGYATEASRVLLAIAFERLGLHRVIGRTEARNDASARLMGRLGMRREAHLVENEWVKGEWQSELVYAILDREWRSATVAEHG
jgi:RimJ/RimL family protein N-acetyltransferase